jgi:hypothetical protein
MAEDSQMSARFAIPIAVLVGVSLVALGRGVRAEEPKDPAADRVKVVRATYEKLPPTILGIKEPIQVKQCQKQITPAAFQLIITDGDNVHWFSWWLEKERYARREYDRIEWTRWKDGTPMPKDIKWHRLAIRGPEEDALYGLLLRWAASKENVKSLSAHDEAVLKDVKVILEKLDDRFASEKPVQVK